MIRPARYNAGRCAQRELELRNLRESDETSRRIIDTALDLEGAVRHASTHAAGVVISEDPLTDYVALQRSTSDDDDDPPTTQFAMGPVASVGLLKMDFLGLTNLTILDRAMALIAETRGEHLSLPEIPVEDPKTFDLLSSGETFGVFQLRAVGCAATSACCSRTRSPTSPP